MKHFKSCPYCGKEMYQADTWYHCEDNCLLCSDEISGMPRRIKKAVR